MCRRSLNILYGEIRYFRIPLLIIFLLPFSFLITINFGITPFQGMFFLDKYLWSMYIGLGSYILIFIIWTLRKKYRRERLHALLPVSRKNLALARWIFAVSPFLLVWFMMMLFKYFVPENEIVHIERSFGQLGLMMIFLGSFDLIINFDNSLGRKFSKRRTKTLAVIITVVVLISIIVVISIVNMATAGIFASHSEQLFLIWAITISIFSARVFLNRKSFQD